MELSEALERLEQMRLRGALSEEEFARAKARLIDNRPDNQPHPMLSAVNAMRRSSNQRWVAGVCGGIALATGTDAWLWRLIFALLFFFGGAGLIVYLLLWLFVPAA